MNLYVVATPIGNLGDCSPRAKEILDKSTLIIAEDTRRTGQLFKLLEIKGKKEFISSHAQSSEKALSTALMRCENHLDISLVTDAGTPTISDPGSLFIKKFRNNYPLANIYPIPGPSALITALSVCGFPASHFEFLGFLPHKKGRQTILNKLKESQITTVFYESPHRIIKTLTYLTEIVQDRQIMIGREMTKQYEEYKIDIPEKLLNYYVENKEKQKGEFVVVISPKFILN